MIDKPRLKTFLTVFPIAADTWGLRGGSEELWRIRLKGERALRTFGALLPYLDGRRSVDEILSALGDQGIDSAAARQLLDYLESNALIERGDDGGLDPEQLERFAAQISFFSRFTSGGGARLQARLLASRIGVVGGGALAGTVVACLTRAGFGDVVALVGEADRRAGHDGGRVAPLDRESVWPADLGEEPPQAVVYAEESFDPALLEALDAFSRDRGVPWLLLRALDPHQGWVGPLFVPGDTPSYRSLDARLRGNLPFYDEYQALEGHLRNGGGPAPPTGGLLPFYDQLAGMAVAELIKLVSGFSVPHLAGRFVTVDLLTWETEVHELLRVPHLEKPTSDHPVPHPWKELPYAEIKTPRA